MGFDVFACSEFRTAWFCKTCYIDCKVGYVVSPLVRLQVYDDNGGGGGEPKLPKI